MGENSSLMYNYILVLKVFVMIIIYFRFLGEIYCMFCLCVESIP